MSSGQKRCPKGSTVLEQASAVVVAVLQEPDVGLLIDVRSEVSFRCRLGQIEGTISRLAIQQNLKAHPVKRRLPVRGVSADEPPDLAAAADFLDLVIPARRIPTTCSNPALQLLLWSASDRRR